MRPVTAYLLALSLLLFSCNKEGNHNIKDLNSDWMSILLDKYPTADINMYSVCMPAAHDAGMYLVQNCSFGGNSCNTQTQYLNMKEMLEAGIRIFDLRPILHKNKYYTEHATDCDGLGCKGDLMDNILDQTRAFLDLHAEIVILNLGHFCKMNGNDPAFINLLEEKLGDKIYRDNDPTMPLIQQPFTTILPGDRETGKVILVFESGFENTAENRSFGYFDSNVLLSEGGWSNKDNYEELKEDQLNRYQAYLPDGKRLFSFSWHMTQDTEKAVKCALNPTGYSIQDMAEKTNEALPGVIDSLVNAGEINRNKHPNVIWVDNSDASATRQCVIISEIALQ